MADSHTHILRRIEAALEMTHAVFERFTAGEIAAEHKIGHGPVTEADKAVDAVLRRELLRESEGWLSEESTDDLARLNKSRVWIVDPLDGTREFVAGIPEFCVSIALVEHGKPVVGGIYNPATRETFLGAIETGVTYNGKPVHATRRRTLEGAVVLASRSEWQRGEWKQFDAADFQVRTVGSVAYKLALVSAGLADATFTLFPKHEWDIAAGVALVESAGGVVRTFDNQSLCLNNNPPLVPGLLACAPELHGPLSALVHHRSKLSSRPCLK